MSEHATRKDIDEVIGVLKDFMSQVDARMTTIEQTNEQRFDNLDDKFNRLMTSIDGFISRIDKYELKLAARDS
ncbi:hypothetical protein JNM87_00435 [Candidatus Saccharibacteria bacterium]|nr:hypothetical protein [Candidatus Saccharibacteria bacterium]